MIVHQYVKKPYTLPLKCYSWIQQEIETLEWAGVIKKSISPWASPIVVGPKKSAPGEPPKHRMCIDFRKTEWTTTRGSSCRLRNWRKHFSCSTTQIDEMYGRLWGAKVFTTLDLRSGYYHIGLSESSKAKTAFVTPFGKYQFEAVPFGLAQAPAYFQQLIFYGITGLQWLCNGLSRWHHDIQQKMKQSTLNTLKLFFGNWRKLFWN